MMTHNPLWMDIQAQGGNMMHVVQHLYAAERPKIEQAAAFLRNERPIVLIGVASAEYLCMPAVVYLGQHGRYASTLCAADALYAYLPMLKNANVVINTRSGETAEIVKLGQALKAHDIPFVAITNEPESTLAKLATHVVWTNTRKDELVSINVVTGMMVATLALAAAVVGELDAIEPAMRHLAGEMSGVVARASGLAAELGGLFEDVRPVYLLYRGHSRGAAYNGRLVLEEIARTPAVAMHAAEFRQGPNEVIDEHFGAVLFVPEGTPGELNLHLAGDIVRSGGRLLVVGAVDSTTLDLPRAQALVFPLPPLPDALQPVLAVVPVQVLAFELAKAQGYEPGQVRYISKVILNEQGIPKEGSFK